MDTWSDLLQNLKKKLNCSNTDLAKVLEVSIPTISSWLKGVDPKGNPSYPTFIYVAILTQMSQIPDARLKEAFKLALARKSMNDAKPKTIACRSLTLQDFEKTFKTEKSCIQTFLGEIFGFRGVV